MGNLQSNQGAKYQDGERKGKKKKHKRKDANGKNKHHVQYSHTTSHSQQQPTAAQQQQQQQQQQTASYKSHGQSFNNKDARNRENIAQKDKELDEARKIINRLEEEKERSIHDLKNKDIHISQLSTEIKEMKSDRDSLLARLSALACAKLTDGNANIADLSDENRPTKIAEMYYELYDNEWTEAYSFLTSDDKRNQDDACQIIVKAFCYIYSACRRKADQDMKNVLAVLKTFYETDTVPMEILKIIKDQRKRHPSINARKIKTLCSHDMDSILTAAVQQSTAVSRFLKKGIEICWLMVIQDPPVYVDVNLSQTDEQFNTNLFKPYTATGKYIEFIIWPVLYLYEGGHVLCKGIAQGKKRLNSTQFHENVGKAEHNKVKNDKIAVESNESTFTGASYVSNVRNNEANSKGYRIEQRSQERFTSPVDNRNGVSCTSNSYSTRPAIDQKGKGKQQHAKCDTKQSTPISNVSLQNPPNDEKIRLDQWKRAQPNESQNQRKHITIISSARM